MIVSIDTYHLLNSYSISHATRDVLSLIPYISWTYECNEYNMWKSRRGIIRQICLIKYVLMRGKLLIIQEKI